MAEYRAATSADVGDIARISVDGWRHAYRGIMDESVLDALNPADRARNRARFLETHSLHTYVCQDSEEIVGFVDFEKCRDEDCADDVGEIWAIYVLPRLIGRGIGRELLLKAHNKLASLGFSEVKIWVLRDNQLARTFYERQGYILDGQTKQYGDSGLNEVRYGRVLPAAALTSER